MKKTKKDNDKVILTIGVASDNTTGINLVDLSAKIEGAAKRIGVKKPKLKISAQISHFS